MTTLDTTLLTCPKTMWIVQPTDVDEPFGVAGQRFVWWHCPVCDWDEHTRRDPAFNPAHPGPHLLPLTSASAPRVWQSRMEAQR
jgi:hypothetical protein